MKANENCDKVNDLLVICYLNSPTLLLLCVLLPFHSYSTCGVAKKSFDHLGIQLLRQNIRLDSYSYSSIDRRNLIISEGYHRDTDKANYVLSH